MHLVKEGFINEFAASLESGDTSQKDSLWWFGRILGLLEAGYLTQEEHDEIANEMIEMFKAKRR